METLRTWEARYGFPVPVRKPSGHRLYPATIVGRLRRIAEALARGHRASETVPASEAQLTAMLGATPAPITVDLPAFSPDGREVAPLMEAVTRFDADALTRALLADWARFGVVEFLERRVAPVVHEVGEAWSTGALQVRHEHFLTERVGDLLRTLRLPFEDRAQGPLVVFATLPGEQHGLGLQMAALVIAAAGCRVLYLGTDVPVDEIAALAADVNARAVAVSQSIASRGEAARADVLELRRRLPRRIALVVGGAGAEAGGRGITRLGTFSSLQSWAAQIVA